MIRKFTFLFYCLFSIFLSAQNYNLELINPKPTDETILDISFRDYNLGFLITENNIFKSNDKGESWDFDKSVSYGKQLNCKEKECLSIEYSKINKYDSITQSWKTIYQENGADFLSLSLVNDSIYYVASKSKLYKTIDGGNKWTSKVINFNVNNIFFTDEVKGFFTTSNGLIGMTLNSGLTWEVVFDRSNIVPSDFHSIYFINDKIGLATLGHGDFLRTTNGGLSWKKINDGYKANKFFFVNDKEGFFTYDYGKLYFTEDAGLTWVRRDLHESYYAGTNLKGLYFINKNEGFIGGLFGRFYKTIDNGITSKQYGITYNDVKSFYSVNNKLYLTTNKEIFKSQDETRTWEKINSATEFGNRKIQFIDDNTALGIFYRDSNNNSADFFKTYNGGKTWNLIKYTSIVDFKLFDAKFGVLRDSDASVHYTVDGGNSYQPSNEKYLTNFQKIGNTVFSNTFNLSSPKIYTSLNNGKTWENIYTFPEGEIYDMKFISENQGYVVGRYDSNFKTTDGGKTWTKMNLPYEWYKHVNFFNNIGLIIDEDGLFYLTKDGGQTWQFILSKYGLTNSYFDSENIYLTGSYGKVYKFSMDELTVNDLEINQNYNFKIFPNPTKDKLNIKLISKLTFSKVEIYNLIGERVLESNKEALNISNLPKGVYVLKLYTKEGKILTKKIIKE